MCAGSFLGDALGAAALICPVLPVFTAFVPFADERAAQRSDRAASARGTPSAQVINYGLHQWCGCWHSWQSKTLVQHPWISKN